MTDPVTLFVASLALSVAIVAAWLQLPHPPDLDAERWFKVILATLLRGRVEAAGGDADAWEREVVRFVPYHPLGRLPERKVARPEIAAMPGKPLPGERALIDRLASLDSLGKRWAWLYDEDPAGRDARLDDPQDLGPAYDPTSALGPGGSWDDLAAWGAAPAGARAPFADALDRRLPLRWVVVRGRPHGFPDVPGALAREAGARVVDWEDGDVDDRAQSLVRLLNDVVPDVTDRAVVVGEGEGLVLVLRALAADAALRDRILAVVAIGGDVLGLPGDLSPYGDAQITDWMGAWFGHVELDTELQRVTPYTAIQWLDRAADPPGAGGLPLEAQRFPEPKGNVVSSSIAAIDLGPLPAEPDLPVDLVARGIRAFVVGWLLATRG